MYSHNVDTIVPKKSFYGKFGISSFVEFLPAQRNFCNKSARIFEMRLSTVTKDVYRKRLIIKLFLNIRAKLPTASKTSVCTQNINARPRISVIDVKFVQ